MAWPLAAQNVLNLGSFYVSMAFAGHLGRDELSAAVLATSILNVTGFAALAGLASAMETLCGQARLSPSLGRSARLCHDAGSCQSAARCYDDESCRVGWACLLQRRSAAEVRQPGKVILFSHSVRVAFVHSEDSTTWTRSWPVPPSLDNLQGNVSCHRAR